jgi:Spy/CpxP family protein refolding chaperone
LKKRKEDATLKPFERIYTQGDAMSQSRKKLLIAFAPLAIAALIAGAAIAQSTSSQTDPSGSQTSAATHPGGHTHAMGLHMLQHLSNRLNLTAEQQASAKQLFQDFHAKAAPIHQAQLALHGQLKAALAAPNPDPAAVGQIVISMHQNRQQLKPALDASMQQFQALLTPDQLAQYKEILASHPFLKRFQAGLDGPGQ